jgi:transcriptional regulator with PAS, ATPase and Fis domain
MLYDATVDHPRYRLESIIGSSRAIAEIKSLVQIAARTDAPVIVEGESGTGKELVAQAIHNAGNRKKYPFVDVNCASIPTELIESTIFGHVKGSFTGAIRTHLGKFELAHKGTLFLDEIGDMPNTMQAKMLKAIEDGKIERLGGEKAISVDVRIIAATNRDITALIEQGDFREDLFFRLNVFRIMIPPLRRRIEDIPALAKGIIKEFFPQSEILVPNISKSYLDRLESHDWPGNVRELRNAIQFSIARLTGDTLEAKHLDHFFHLKTKAIPSLPEAGPKNQKLEEITRQVIQVALEEHQGNKSEAARALGISRGTLYRKLK